jgi:hypothetical protein
VYPKRMSPDEEQTQDNDTPVMAETVRSASAAAAARPAATGDEHKISVFWRVFGGTILSIAALVAITIFNNVQSSISELRADAARAREALALAVKREDLDREREARAGLAKKDDVDARVKTIYERLRTFDAYKGDIEAVKERVSATSIAVAALKTDVGASVDALKRDSATLEVMRERFTLLSGEVKLATEAAQRVQTDVEKNRASDLERKLSRDAQAKSVEESLREMQRAVQDCREKLARLEGASPSIPVRTPAPRPAEPKSDD